MKGFNIRISTPPARLDRLPCTARPMATPAEPSTATMLAASTPQAEARKRMSSTYRDAFTNESTNCTAPTSALARCMERRMILRTILIAQAPIKKTRMATATRKARCSAPVDRSVKNLLRVLPFTSICSIFSTISSALCTFFLSFWKLMAF